MRALPRALAALSLNEYGFIRPAVRIETQVKVLRMAAGIPPEPLH